MKIIFFQKTYFSSKCSSGHVECSYEKPDEKFYSKSENISQETEKTQQIKNFFPEVFLNLRSFDFAEC